MSRTRTQNSSRIWQIDAIRGLALLGMILYHTLFALLFFADVPIPLFHWSFELFQKLVAGTFLLLVGVSITLSWKKQQKFGTSVKNIFLNFLKRSLFLLLCASGITIATWLLVPDLYIRFGVLHCIAISTLLALPFVRWPLFSLALGSALLFVRLVMPFLLAFPLLPSGNEFWLWLGLVPEGFATLDYFPLLPWFGVILIGTWVGNVLWTSQIPASRNPVPWLTFLGQNSLVIYMIHPVFLTFGVLVLQALR